MKVDKIFVLTSEVVDSDYERVLLSGMSLERFKANPIMLYGHDRSKTIGRWVDIEVKDGKLIAKPDFNVNYVDQAFINFVIKSVQNNYLRAASIGFRTKGYGRTSEVDPETGRSVYVITASELMEASIVPIGANPQAVSQEKQEKDEGKQYRRKITITGGEDVLFKIDQINEKMKKEEEKKEEEKEDGAFERSMIEKLANALKDSEGILAAYDEGGFDAVAKLLSHKGSGKTGLEQIFNKMESVKKNVERDFDEMSKNSPEELRALYYSNRQEFIEIYKKKYGEFE